MLIPRLDDQLVEIPICGSLHNCPQNAISLSLSRREPNLRLLWGLPPDGGLKLRSGAMDEENVDEKVLGPDATELKSCAEDEVDENETDSFGEGEVGKTELVNLGMEYSVGIGMDSSVSS